MAKCKALSGSAMTRLRQFLESLGLVLTVSPVASASNSVSRLGLQLHALHKSQLEIMCLGLHQ